MPKALFGANHAFLPRSGLLSFEEIARLAGLFAQLGVNKLRLTGGEPLVRHGLEDLVAQLAAIPGMDDICLTTNASLLTADKAQQLADAGLGRITVSLDAIDDETFHAVNDVGFPVARVLAGIDNAAAAGLQPVKVNMVVKRGLNDHAIEAMAEHFRGSDHILRFIEFIDVDNANGWRLDSVVTAREMLERIDKRWSIEPLDAQYPGEVARRWRYRDGGGEIGVIASITRPFCSSCTRARLSAEGRLYTCLFAGEGFDLRERLRGGASDEELASDLSRIWHGRNDRYSEIRSQATPELGRKKIEMSYIGG